MSTEWLKASLASRELRELLELKEYVMGVIPKRVAPGRILVHNHVKPTSRIGSRGFRCWLDDPNPTHYVVCRCEWAPHQPRHYRVRGTPSRTRQ
jgi:hypothetical protein